MVAQSQGEEKRGVWAWKKGLGGCPWQRGGGRIQGGSPQIQGEKGSGGLPEEEVGGRDP